MEHWLLAIREFWRHLSAFEVLTLVLAALAAFFGGIQAIQAFLAILAYLGFVKPKETVQTLPGEPHFLPNELKVKRSQMIRSVRYKVEKQLNRRSLYKVARIDLGFEDAPDAVADPLTLLVQEAGGNRGGNRGGCHHAPGSAQSLTSMRRVY